MSPAKRVFTSSKRRLAGPETRQPHFSLDLGGGPLGFLLHFRYGHGDFERMLTPFD